MLVLIFARCVKIIKKINDKKELDSANAYKNNSLDKRPPLQK